MPGARARLELADGSVRILECHAQPDGKLEVTVDGASRGADGVAIGRSRACDVVLDGDERVSARHCRVAAVRDAGGAPEFALVDCSRHGTFLVTRSKQDGSKVPRRVARARVRLRPGDEIALLPPTCTSAPEALKRRLTLGFAADGARAPLDEDASLTTVDEASLATGDEASLATADAPESAAPLHLPSMGGAEGAKAAGLLWGKLADARSMLSAKSQVAKQLQGERDLSALPPVSLPGRKNHEPLARMLPRRLRRELESDDAGKRASAVRALGGMHAGDHLEAATSLAARRLERDADARVREAAVLALETLGRAGNYYLIEPHIAALAARVADDDEDQYVREQCARVIGAFGQRGLDITAREHGDLLADGLQADWGVAEAAGVALIDIQLAEPFRVIDPPWNRKKYGFDWDGQPC